MISTMADAISTARRRELGAFLRARREKLAPAAVGLPAGARRRVRGLRREELAQLAGLSVTWYTWIEQGRDVAVSSAALARLAEALRLDRAARAYLFELAGRRDPGGEETADETLPPALPACVAAIVAPAYVLDRAWNVRCWNAPAERLFTGWLDRPGERNLLRFIFLDPAAPSLIDDWPERARRVVAEFRADGGPHLEEPPFRTLIDELRRDSTEFRLLWDERAVLSREGGERTFNHPLDGFLRFEQLTFTLATKPGLKLTMLVPGGRAPPAA
jgi:transcriptional regulator with XRE-family HTH domain